MHSLTDGTGALENGLSKMRYAELSEIFDDAHEIGSVYAVGIFRVNDSLLSTHPRPLRCWHSTRRIKLLNYGKLS